MLFDCFYLYLFIDEVLYNFFIFLFFMPQLDLSMFFYHILAFTYFFFSIYLFIRGSFIPNISTIMKYRKKITYYFIFQKEFFLKKYNFFNFFLDTKVNSLINSYLKIIFKYIFITNLIFSF